MVGGGVVPTQTEVVMTQNTDRLQWPLHKQRPHYHAPALLASLSMFHGKQCRIISAERRTNKQITRFPLSLSSTLKIITRFKKYRVQFVQTFTPLYIENNLEMPTLTPQVVRSTRTVRRGLSHKIVYVFSLNHF